MKTGHNRFMPGQRVPGEQPSANANPLTRIPSESCAAVGLISDEKSRLPRTMNTPCVCARLVRTIEALAV
jgi:hypothetical protein